MSDNDFSLLVSIDSKVDEVKDKLHNIELIQTRMESDLKYHIKRTDILEQKVLEIDDKVKPVENAKNAIWGISKVLAFLTGVGVALLTIFKFFSKD